MTKFFIEMDVKDTTTDQMFNAEVEIEREHLEKVLSKYNLKIVDRD